MLELRVSRFDRVRSANRPEAAQREVIMQGQNFLCVVEALDVLVGLREVLRAIDVLQHVHVLRDVLDPAVGVDQVVEEVDVADVVRSALVRADFERLGQHGEH